MNWPCKPACLQHSRHKLHNVLSQVFKNFDKYAKSILHKPTSAYAVRPFEYYSTERVHTCTSTRVLGYSG